MEEGAGKQATDSSHALFWLLSFRSYFSLVVLLLLRLFSSTTQEVKRLQQHVYIYIYICVYMHVYIVRLALFLSSIVKKKKEKTMLA